MCTALDRARRNMATRFDALKSLVDVVELPKYGNPIPCYNSLQQEPKLKLFVDVPPST